MFIAYKYKLCPTEEQKDQLDNNMAAARFVYNQILSANTAHFEETGECYFPKVSEIKKDHKFLEDADSLALCNAKINVETAFKNYFRTLSKNIKNRWRKPRFKSIKQFRQSYKTNRIIVIREKDRVFVKLPKITPIEVVYHREMQGQIKSATIVKNKYDKYEISILCKYDSQVVNTKSLQELSIVGIDMSFKNFAVLSTGEKMIHPHYFRKTEAKYKNLQKKFDKKCHGSRNHSKARKKLAKLADKIANQRKDFCHKMSKRLVQEYDVIVLENISMSLKARQLNFAKSVYDLGFGMFRDYLRYKANLLDKYIYLVDRLFPSTQLCSACGFQDIKLRNMKICQWKCEKCNSFHDRDENAALNIKNYFVNKLTNQLASSKYKKYTAGAAGIYACGDKTSISTLSLNEKLNQVLSLNQENRLGKMV